MDTTVRTECQGCGAPLLPARGPGQARQWCSDRCRKDTTYHHECIDCGTKLNSSDGPGPRAPVRCVPCAVAQSRTMEGRQQRRALARETGRRWADVQIFEAIRSVAENGIVSKTAYEMRRVARGTTTMPSVPGLALRFGSWRNAVHAAGLQVANERHPTQYASRISDDSMLLAVEDCAAGLGHWPSAQQYDNWAAGGVGPSGALIRGRFGGSWVAVLETAEARNGGEVPK